MHYENFDVVLPARRPKTYTSTTPGPDVLESKMASSSAQAIGAFNRLSDQEKTKVLAYLCAGHPPKSVQETKEEELQKLTMVAVILLLLFTFCFYMAWAVTVSPAQ